MNRTITLKILLAQKSGFLALFSAQYPLTRRLLDLGKHYWDWDALSSNRVLCWDIDLLKKYNGRWNRCEGQGLQNNPALPWSAEHIKDVAGPGMWRWLGARDKETLTSDPQLMALCLSHWKEEYSLFKSPPLHSYQPLHYSTWAKGGMPATPAGAGSEQALIRDQFSDVIKFPWTSVFIESRDARGRRSRRTGFGAEPWSAGFVSEFLDRWEWSLMCPDIHWEEEGIAALEDKWNWRLLSMEGKVAWEEKMLVRFADRLWWAIPDMAGNVWQGTFSGIINCPGVSWTPKLYEAVNADIQRHFIYLTEKFMTQEVRLTGPGGRTANWTYFCNTGNWTPAFCDWLERLEKKTGILFIDWEKLCMDGRRLWSDAFIAGHRMEIETKLVCLCQNPHFPWEDYLDTLAPMIPPCGWSDLSRRQDLQFTPGLLSLYVEKWDWTILSGNPSLTRASIANFEDRLEWQSLAANPSLSLQTIYDYLPRWDQTCWRRLSRLPCVDLETIDETLPWDWVEILRRQVAQGKGRLTDYVDEGLLETFLKTLKGGL